MPTSDLITTRYEHTGKGPIIRRAESVERAANILARREYGRHGVCRVLRLDCWTKDGLSADYQAFIGRAATGDAHTVTGRNVWIYVRRANAQ